MKGFHTSIFLFLFLFLSCKQEIKKEVKLKENKKDVDKFDSFPKDVFYVNNDCVLFLKPSEKYFEKKLKNEEGIEEVSSDFEYYANEFYKNQKDKRKIYFVTQRTIALINSKKDTVLLDRYKKDLIYGVVIQQKDSVQILEGVQTNIDLDIALGIFNPNK